MLKVTFKNVGQGDSIVLEWNHKGINKIGIVDCNLLSSGNNPTLDYIQYLEVKEIEFIILSHPHFDHYSGLYGILNFCELNDISIKYFLHTSMQVPEYIQTAVKSEYAGNELAKLFIKVRKLYKSGIIHDHGYVNNNSREIEINDQIRLKFLSPSPVECDNYVNHVPLYHEEDGHNNPNANWLSTFIKIYNENWFILLTSDVDKSVLIRIGKKHPEELAKTLFLGQSPHHGSWGNHRNSFWKTGIKKRLIKTPIVFSVGNNIYRHPSRETVDFFRSHDYSIYSTNQTGCLNSIDDKIVLEVSTLLDTVSTYLSTKSPNKSLNGDKVFEITDENLRFVE